MSAASLLFLTPHRVATKIRPHFLIGPPVSQRRPFDVRFRSPDFISQRCPFLYVDTPW
jgi:hypothetical protein